LVSGDSAASTGIIWQSADQTEARYNSTTPSGLSQLVDLAESSSGDVTLSAMPATAEQGGEAKPANPAAQAAVIADAATIVAAFGDGSDGGDSGGVFHFSTAPDVFWFNDNQTSFADQNPIAGGRLSADDQSALVDSFVGRLSSFSKLNTCFQNSKYEVTSSTAIPSLACWLEGSLGLN
jgi:hypothetical protein